MYPKTKSIKPDICTKSYKDTTTLPVQIADCVSWLRLTSSVVSQQASLFTSLIYTAREILERYLWIDITQATYQAEYDVAPWGLGGLFSGDIKLILNRAPIWNMSNIQSVQYLDANGYWDSYVLGTNLGIDGIFATATARPEKMGWASIYFPIAPAFDTTRINAYKIQITFNAGYDWSGYWPLQAMPVSIATAFKMIVSYLYSNIGDIIDGSDIAIIKNSGAKGLLDPFSVSATQLG